MTTEKHDPWALLREARNWVGGWSGILPMAGKDIDALRARIDAALAEREVEERYDAQADERKAIWRAYAERQLSEDEAKARLAALEAK